MTVNGTLTRGTSAFTTGSGGKFGEALSGGVYGITGADAANISASSAFSNDATYEAWIKTTASGAVRVAFGRSRFWWIGVTATGMPTCQPGYTPSTYTLTGTTAINDGAWHHVALVMSPAGGSLYVDGSRVATSTAAAVAGTEDGGAKFGGFTTVATYDWAAAGGGLVDEVRISSTQRYSGTTYTVPTAAFTTDASTLALYHLDGDALDTGGSTNALSNTAAPAVTGSAATGQTLSVSNGTWSATPDSYTYVWRRAGVPISGTTSSTYVLQVADDGQVISASVTAVKSTYTSASKTSNAVTSVPAGTPLAANDTNIVYSPYNWDITSARALTNCGGAYLRTLIGGTPTAIVLNFDVTNLTGTNTTQIKYRVDGGSWTSATIAAAVSVAIPSETASWTKHLVEVVVKTSTEGANRWASPYATAAVLTGISVSPSTCTTLAIQQAPLKGVVFGDSITEGISTLPGSGDATVRSDSTLAFSYRLRDILGAEVGVVGFGRQGVSVVGNGSVPVLGSTWNLNAAGLTRSFTPAPDFVVVNIGTNDSINAISSATFQTALTSLLNAMLSALTAPLFVLLPFGGYYGTTVYQTAIAATTAPARITFIDTTGWFNTADSTDTVHPYGYAHVTSLAPRLAAALRPMLGSKRFVNVGGVAKPIVV